MFGGSIIRVVYHDAATQAQNEHGHGPAGCRLAAASAGTATQKPNDLVREAVGYSGVLGGAAARVVTCTSQRIIPPVIAP